MNPTGTVLVLVKGVRDTLPFALAAVDAERVGSASWIFSRPLGLYKRGSGGVEYKLRPETYWPHNKEL